MTSGAARKPLLEGAKITSSEITALTIPTDQPESDGTATWDSTTVVIVELSAGGKTGLGYAYAQEAAAPLAKQLVERHVLHASACDIPALHSALDIQVRNWGRPGLVSSAIAAIDNCLWDLKARLLEQPVVNLFGKIREEITAYGSGGFTSYSEHQLLDQLGGWAAEGFPQVKMKIGREPSQDLKRVEAVQKALSGRAELFVDANGAYDRKQALHRSRQFADMEVTWFEEPVTSDDRTGLRMLVENAPTPVRVAAGEYIYVLDDARLLIESEAVDVLQTDATRCGGVTNFMKIGAACEINHLPFSAHTAPSLHASLCCALVKAINVEYFHDHVRIEHMIFDGAITARQGRLKPDISRPGFGLELKRAAAEKFRVFSAKIQ